MNTNVTPGGKSAYYVGHPLVHGGLTGTTHFNDRTEKEVCY